MRVKLSHGSLLSVTFRAQPSTFQDFTNPPAYEAEAEGLKSSERFSLEFSLRKCNFFFCVISRRSTRIRKAMLGWMREERQVNTFLSISNFHLSMVVLFPKLRFNSVLSRCSLGMLTVNYSKYTPTCPCCLATGFKWSNFWNRSQDNKDKKTSLFTVEKMIYLSLFSCFVFVIKNRPLQFSSIPVPTFKGYQNSREQGNIL